MCHWYNQGWKHSFLDLIALKWHKTKGPPQLFFINEVWPFQKQGGGDLNHKKAQFITALICRIMTLSSVNPKFNKGRVYIHNRSKTLQQATFYVVPQLFILNKRPLSYIWVTSNNSLKICLHLSVHQKTGTTTITTNCLTWPNNYLQDIPKV